jgi:hypothetical protein
MGFQAGSCGNSDDGRDSVSLLRHLTDPARKDSALATLPNTLFLEQDLPALYQALDRAYPDDSLAYGTRTALLGVLENVNNETTPGFIETLIAGFSQHPLLQRASLRVLAAMHTPASLSILAATLNREPEHFPAMQPVDLLQLIPDTALHYLFPDFFGRSHEQDWRLPVYEALASALASGTMAPAVMKDSLPVMIAQYDQLRQSRKKHDGKRDADELELRTCMDLMLHVMAHYAVRPEVNQLLVRGMADKDPDLRLSAAFASFEAGIPVTDSVIGSLAADFRVRNQLFLRLNEQHLDRRFPVRYHTQQAIAESDLATWLANPENSGRFPEAMKFVKKIPIENDLATGNLFVFHFRYPGDTWRIGISGPQPPDTTEVRVGGYLTNSLYKTDRQIDLEEHIRELME